MNQEDLRLLGVLNTHFIGFGWVDCLNKGDKPENSFRVFCASGFLVCHQGEWYLVTAGHLLHDLDTKLPAEGRRIVRSALFAGWSPEGESVTRVTFDYAPCLTHYVDDDQEGIDVGMIYLDEQCRKDLSTVGAAPITNLDLPAQEYDQHWLHGLPEQLQCEAVQESCESIDCQVCVTPVVFQVFPLDGGTGGFSPTKRRRLIASIRAEVPLSSVKGMSGGPIYAMKASDKGLDLWIAGVQSEQQKTTRNIAACPNDVLLEVLAQGHDKIQTMRKR